MNLEVALRYLRYRNMSRLLWIDASFIDQNNIAEKSQQVSRMAMICKTANRVIVWLGEEDDTSDAALEILELLGRKVGVDWFIDKIKPSKGAGDDHLAATLQNGRRSQGPDFLQNPKTLQPWFPEQIKYFT